MSGREGGGRGVGQKSKGADALSPPSLSRADFFIDKRNFDLFGQPLAAVPRAVGRPRHAETEENRLKVKELRSFGLRHDEIAAALGISAPTLRMIYFQELGSRSTTGLRRAERDASCQ